MCTAAAPASASGALGLLHAGLRLVQAAAGFLAAADTADLPAGALAEGLRELECADAASAAVRGRFLEAFDAQDGPVADGQRTVRTWLVHSTLVTRDQAAEHQAVEAGMANELRPGDPREVGRYINPCHRLPYYTGQQQARRFLL